ncbi:MAG: DNA recombination protein RmuC, partial [Proteobacteria bacterium]|nr:DNA recombination protein RmuC [Pseudomonadota bacterium]
MSDTLQLSFVIAGFTLLLGIVIMLVWQTVTTGRRERLLPERIIEASERCALDQHRELLRDLHEGLERQTDRIGEHARADRELLQNGLTAASMQLSRAIETLTRSVEGQLQTLSGQVNTRLDEGLR